MRCPASHRSWTSTVQLVDRTWPTWPTAQGGWPSGPLGARWADYLLRWFGAGHGAWLHTLPPSLAALAGHRPNGCALMAGFDAHRYGIDPTNTARGGLLLKPEAGVETGAGGGAGGGASSSAGKRQIFLLQRKTGKLGAGLGRTTGWIHRLDLKKLGVTTLGGVSYEKVRATRRRRYEASLSVPLQLPPLPISPHLPSPISPHIAPTPSLTPLLTRSRPASLDIVSPPSPHHPKVDDAGLHISLKGNPKKGEPPSARVLDVDTVVVCAGQTSQRELEQPLQALGVPVYLIGGAQEATELDAKRAIDQGSRLAAALEEAKPEAVADYVAPLGFDGWLFQQINSRRKGTA